MSNTLSQLADSTSKGLRELSQHPIQYTSRAAQELITDYWDLGAAVAAGFALHDYHGEHFGDYRWLTVIGGIIGASIPAFLGSSDDRLGDRSKRNLSGFLTGMTFSWMYNSPPNEEPLPVLNKTLCYSPSIFLSGCTIFLDRERRKEKRYNNQSDTIEVEAISLD